MFPFSFLGGTVSRRCTNAGYTAHCLQNQRSSDHLHSNRNHSYTALHTPSLGTETLRKLIPKEKEKNHYLPVDMQREEI